MYERWMEEGFGTPAPARNGQKKFDPHQPRDPLTGRWIDTSGFFGEISGKLASHGVGFKPPDEDVTNLTHETATEIADTVSAAVERYPILTREPTDKHHRNLTEVMNATSGTQLARIVGAQQIGTGALMSTVTSDRWDHTVLVTNDLDGERGDPTEGWITPASSTYTGATWHEMGHALGNAAGVDQPEWSRDLRSRNWGSVMAGFGITDPELAGLSEYAARDNVEALGELSAMYHTPGYAKQLTPELRAKAEKLFAWLGEGAPGYEMPDDLAAV